MARIPIILDTDIGGDIDDTWALAQLLRSPELDPKLVVTATADTVYRAEVTAKLLANAGRADIPIGIGRRFPSDGPRELQRPGPDATRGAPGEWGDGGGPVPRARRVPWANDRRPVPGLGVPIHPGPVPPSWRRRGQVLPAKA